eukprot:gene9786-20352_t
MIPVESNLPSLPKYRNRLHDYFCKHCLDSNLEGTRYESRLNLLSSKKTDILNAIVVNDDKIRFYFSVPVTKFDKNISKNSFAPDSCLEDHVVHEPFSHSIDHPNFQSAVNITVSVILEHCSTARNLLSLHPEWLTRGYPEGSKYSGVAKEVETVSSTITGDKEIHKSQYNQHGKSSLEYLKRNNYDTANVGGVSVVSISGSSLPSSLKVKMSTLRLPLYEVDTQSLSSVEKESVARVLNVIGSQFYHRKQWDEALAYFLKVMNIDMDHTSSSHAPMLAKIYSNLGAVYYKRREYSLAKNHYEEALYLYNNGISMHVLVTEEVLLPKARCLSSLGTTLRAMNCTASAVERYQEALAIFTYLFDTNHTNVLRMKSFISSSSCTGSGSSGSGSGGNSSVVTEESAVCVQGLKLRGGTTSTSFSKSRNSCSTSSSDNNNIINYDDDGDDNVSTAAKNQSQGLDSSDSGSVDIIDKATEEGTDRDTDTDKHSLSSPSSSPLLRMAISLSESIDSESSSRLRSSHNSGWTRTRRDMNYFQDTEMVTETEMEMEELYVDGGGHMLLGLRLREEGRGGDVGQGQGQGTILHRGTFLLQEALLSGCHEERWNVDDELLFSVDEDLDSEFMEIDGSDFKKEQEKEAEDEEVEVEDLSVTVVVGAIVEIDGDKERGDEKDIVVAIIEVDDDNDKEGEGEEDKVVATVNDQVGDNGGGEDLEEDIFLQNILIQEVERIGRHRHRHRDRHSDRDINHGEWVVVDVQEREDVLPFDKDNAAVIEDSQSLPLESEMSTSGQDVDDKILLSPSVDVNSLWRELNDSESKKEVEKEDKEEEEELFVTVVDAKVENDGDNEGRDEKDIVVDIIEVDSVEGKDGDKKGEVDIVVATVNEDGDKEGNIMIQTEVEISHGKWVVADEQGEDEENAVVIVENNAVVLEEENAVVIVEKNAFLLEEENAVVIEEKNALLLEEEN